MGLWHVFTGIAARPLSTLRWLQGDDRAGWKGLWMLLLVIGAYTLILGIFILRGYPAVAPSILNLSVESQYSVQIWYQGPLFLASTALVAGLLLLLSRARKKSARFSTLFARVSFSTALPFALTTMLVELSLALLLLLNVLAPDEVLRWLTADGLWFASLYQAAGILWLVVLMVLACKVTLSVRWGAAIATGCVLTVIYALPVALFIR